MKILVVVQVIFYKILIVRLDQYFKCQYVAFLIVRDDFLKTDFSL